MHLKDFAFGFVSFLVTQGIAFQNGVGRLVNGVCILTYIQYMVHGALY